MADEELLDQIDNILDDIEEFWAIAVTDELVDAVILAFTVGLADSATYMAELKGISVGVSFNVVDPEVIEFLKEHAAEMVRNINKGTRFYLRSMIYTGFQEGVGEEDLVKTILDGLFDVSDFSENRVRSIARFEIAKAQTKGWIKQLNEVGVKTKVWVTIGEDACETCKENAAMGPQPVNSKNYLTVFGSEKTDGPPAHPNVERCHLGIPADELDKMGMTVEWYTGKSEVTEMGSKRSGHWGHKGRKGKRGGSLPSKGGKWSPTMTPSKSKQWNKGTAYGGETFYHFTRAKSVESIQKEGFKETEGFYGTGIYLTDISDPEGTNLMGSEARLDIAVKVSNPIVFEGAAKVGNWAGKMLDKNPEKYSMLEPAEIAKAEGYDALSMKRRDGSTWLIVFDKQNITATGSAEL